MAKWTKCPTLALWLVGLVSWLWLQCTVNAVTSKDSTAKPQKSIYIFIQATESHTEPAFVLNLKAAYYRKYMVEGITASRLYTIRDTAASYSHVLNLSTAKLEPSDQIHVPGTSTPITEFLDRRLGAPQTLLHALTQGQLTCTSHQQPYHNLIFVVPCIMHSEKQHGITRRWYLQLNTTDNDKTTRILTKLQHKYTCLPERPYTALYSWWLVELSPETCRAKPLRRINAIVASCWNYFTTSNGSVKRKATKEFSESADGTFPHDYL